MAEVKSFTAPFLASPLKLPDAQHSMACASRALAQLTQGFMSAGLAQMELARSLMTTAPDGWTPVQTGDPADVAHNWLKTNALRFDTTLRTYRKINDDLAASLFAAADSFWEAAGEPDQAVPAAPRSGAAKSS